MQITLNGFTFIRNADSTDNIQSVLKNKDNKALGGIVKEGNNMAKLSRLQNNPGVLDFLAKVLDETNQIYTVQKAAKPRNKYAKKFSPNIHSIGV